MNHKEIKTLADLKKSGYESKALRTNLGIISGRKSKRGRSPSKGFGVMRIR